ncbi:MAG: GDP-mannose 4,6-dehydratase [Firmicutes bacterium]|nr:GDP-mannose 4,6-dehydratase [Bacillota bacterium]
MKKALITGITGFAGSHLADYLLKHTDCEVYGTVRWRSKRQNIRHLQDKVTLLECELKDATSVDELIERVRPDYIFHLAAQSFVPTSWHSPTDTIVNNITGQLNLFEAVREYQPEAVIQIACSSEEYGLVYPSEVPITEESPLRPMSPYAVSKIAQDFMAYQYYQSYGLKTIRTRAFNHTGPRRGEVFVCSNFARQIAEIELGLREPVVYVGNLEARRDFTDVRDMVRGYWLAVTKGEPGELYQLCSGRAWSIREVLEFLVDFSGVKIEVQEDPERMRPSDVPLLLGSYEKFEKQTGWSPEIPFEQTLADLLVYWRQELAK